MNADFFQEVEWHFDSMHQTIIYHQLITTLSWFPHEPRKTDHVI